MNNAYAMSASFESKKNTQASMITAAFAAFMLLLMFLLKWSLPVIAAPPPEQVLVDLDLPDEEVITARQSGGGGGGNPVQAAGPAGAAPYAPPNPGTNDDSRDVEESKDEAEPKILKPDNPKPTATKVNENKSVVKTETKPVPQPAPQQPKHVLNGRTLTGSGNGGGAAQDYDRSGGTGTGSGIGNGSGTGGGTGTGSGGGNGSGTGLGNGPRVTKGDRRIVSTYSFEGDLDKATIHAEIKVSPDGIGTLERFVAPSTSYSSDYRSRIVQYLRNIRFNKDDHESTVTVVFNFRVNG